MLWPPIPTLPIQIWTKTPVLVLATISRRTGAEQFTEDPGCFPEGPLLPKNPCGWSPCEDVLEDGGSRRENGEWAGHRSAGRHSRRVHTVETRPQALHHERDLTGELVQVDVGRVATAGRKEGDLFQHPGGGGIGDLQIVLGRAMKKQGQSASIVKDEAQPRRGKGARKVRGAGTRAVVGNHARRSQNGGSSRGMENGTLETKDGE
jgi:hypothetical protein